MKSCGIRNSDISDGRPWSGSSDGVSDGLHPLPMTQEASRKPDLLVELLVLSSPSTKCSTKSCDIFPGIGEMPLSIAFEIHQFEVI